MACEAIGRRVREGSVLVTIQACGFLVLANQRVFRGVVIELGFGPFGRLMTRRAVVIQRIFMRFIVAVTIDAVRRRFPMLFVGGVTVAALGFEMSAGDLEVGEGVVEIAFDKNNNIGIAAFVIGVAGRALVVAGLRMKSVIAVGSVNIRSYIFVAIHTQLPLGRLVEHRMTRRALGLYVGMAGDDLTRHKNGLDFLCRCLAICKEPERHYQSNSYVSRPAHVARSSG